MDNFLKLCSAADRVFFTPAQGRQAAELAECFLLNYLRVAQDCFRRGLVFFNLVPKFHYFARVAWDLRQQEGSPSVLNPAAAATQMAEDFVGRASVMSRTTHQKCVALRTAQKWRLDVKLRWAGQR
jgi:hypothetical protein